MTFFKSHWLEISNFPLFSLFQYISPLFREHYYFPLLWQISPLFSKNSPAFYIGLLYVHFVSPYFDHDAFMHHPVHVLMDAPV